jgi:hypothetical protein
MFEDLAIELSIALGSTGVAPQIILASLILCGCVAGILFRRSRAPMGRIPFFALNMLFVLAYMSLLVAVATFDQPALIGGYVWALMAALTLGPVGYGYAVGRIAAARAIDSFGSKWAGLIVVAPVVNIILVLKRSRAPGAPTPRLLSGIPGLAIGIVATIATVAAQAVLTRPAPLTPSLEHQAKIAMFEHEIRYLGAGPAAQRLTAAVKTPLVLTPDVTLMRVESDGKTIWRDISIDLPADVVFSTDLREQTIRETCKGDWTRRLLKGGLRMEVRFIRRVADITDVVTVDEKACNSLPAAPTAAS